MALHEYPETNGGWKKYEGNPVLGSAEMGTCFDVYVTHLNGEYQMHFSWRPRKSLALVTSKDGIHWSEPVITLTPKPETGWEEDLNRHCVVFKDGVWHMWYTGQAHDHGYSWIGYATSTDGVHFERYQQQPIIYPERPFEGESCMCPFVMWDEEMNIWRMWYAAGETYEPNVLCYATSTDGIHWNKLPANPIIVRDKSHPYEFERVGPCQVIKADGWHYIFYIGYEDIDTARVCVARSKDGIAQWERLKYNPIVSPTKGSWDESACYKPSVVRDEENNRWLLWYNGRNGAPEYIGLVIHEGLDLGFDD